MLRQPPILEMLGDVRGRTVLDVDCGDATPAIELHKLGAIVTGIDMSNATIEAARAAARQRGAAVAFVVGPAKSIPFRQRTSISWSR
jgi:2-polyprenyl-3-methyl-5-hydroxy-6-metoxy-1,4-benzoquinol methylase